MNIFMNLPIELISIILVYEGSLLRERNGKMMNQVVKTDKRYSILSTIPKKRIYGLSRDLLYMCYSLSICDLNVHFRINMMEYDNYICYILYKDDFCIEKIYSN
jgi:hypothetical protein